MHRRTVLAGVGVTIALAGCASDGGGERPPEPLDGEWAVRASVVNEDDEPREWRVESRSLDRESVAAASVTLPPGETTELELLGRLFDERREIVVESGTRRVSEAWNPTDCRRIVAAVSIVGATPSVETECREA